jgi:hypothetical protein
MAAGMSFFLKYTLNGRCLFAIVVKKHLSHFKILAADAQTEPDNDNLDLF